MNTTVTKTKQHGIGWLNGHKTQDGTLMTPETWNPVSGCSPVSEGCDNCYASTMGNRMKANPRSVRHGKEFSEVMFHPERLAKPLGWKKSRVVFVNSMSDLFHGSVTFEQIAAVFGIMAATPWHRYIILTKRPERAKEFFNQLDEEQQGGAMPTLGRKIYKYIKLLDESDQQSWPLPNVWLGVSAENQEQADKRLPILLDLKAGGHISKAMVSIEPMLDWIGLTRFSHSYGPVHGGVFNALTGFVSIYQRKNWQKIAALDWVIVGGETGSKARPMHPDWVRSIRDQCKETSTPFYFKQWGEWATKEQGQNIKKLGMGAIEYTPPSGVKYFKLGKKAAGHLLDGVEHLEIPG
jgi:protein gp37